MKTVAFLQNMWLNNPESFKRNFLAAEADKKGSGEEYRRRIIHYALFRGCLTGRRLIGAFGKKVCDEIIWEESTREIANNPRQVFPPDYEHMQDVLDEIKPDVVITFGAIAREDVKKLWGGNLIVLPHPAARGAEIIPRLLMGAEMLKKTEAIYAKTNRTNK